MAEYILNQVASEVQQAINKALTSVQTVNGVKPDESGNVRIEVGGADWNQNDPKAPDYVKNRPFYGNIETIEVNETCNVGGYSSGYNKAKELGNLLQSDNDLSNVVVTINETEYALVYNDNLGWWDLKDGGNYSIQIGSTGTYILASYLSDGTVSGTATFTGYYKTGEIKQLDPKYIKDMYYTEGGLVEILPETTLTTDENNPGEFAITENPPVLEAGKTYIVNWNGTEHKCIGLDLSALASGGVGLGDVYTYTDGAVGTAATGEPFIILYVPGTALFAGDIYSGATSVTIAIYGNGEIVHKLDAKYLPTPDLVITISHSLDFKVNASDVDITGGSVEAVCEKLLSGVPVDIRVRGFEKSGSYAAYADEVTARGLYYGERLFVDWLVVGAEIRTFGITFNMDGTIFSTSNRKVATTKY